MITQSVISVDWKELVASWPTQQISIICIRIKTKANSSTGVVYGALHTTVNSLSITVCLECGRTNWHGLLWVIHGCHTSRHLGYSKINRWLSSSCVWAMIYERHTWKKYFLVPSETGLICVCVCVYSSNRYYLAFYYTSVFQIVYMLVYFGLSFFSVIYLLIISN